MNGRIAAAGFAMFALSIAAFAQGPRRDGNWEVQTQMEMAGMPAAIPPFTSTHCVTPEEANDPSKLMPQGRGGRGRVPRPARR